MMVTVILALVPCLLFGMWNIGDQHYAAMNANAITAEFGVGYFPEFIDKFIYGAIKVVPILAVSYIVGLGIEFTFATIRRHPIAEGYLVSGLLIPMIIPATTPLWEVGLASAFAVILGKEVFGGTGMNLLNPALTARAFLFFAYPVNMSGNGDLWVPTDGAEAADLVDGFTGATVLEYGAVISRSAGQIDPEIIAESDKAAAALGGIDFWDMFIGTIPGSVGETSTLMCLLGAGILIFTGVGSWRIMLSMAIGGLAAAFLLENVANIQFLGSDHFYNHLVAGGFAFGAVFMATDPVSASHTSKGKYIYGFLAGLLAILIRVSNPAYPEGVMLAILLMNVVAPTIDYAVVSSNKKRRLKRATV